MMSWLEKFILKLYQKPQPKDISYKEACRFLQALGWRMKQRRGTSHVHFAKPDWIKLITLVENKDLKPYHIRLIKEYLVDKGIVERDENED